MLRGLQDNYCEITAEHPSLLPLQDVLRTEYVEHDLDSSVVDMNPVQYLVGEEALKGKGVDEAKASDVLSTMGFSDALRQSPISALSGGWKMKLALARAMLIEADILLLGTPLATSTVQASSGNGISSHLKLGCSPACTSPDSVCSVRWYSFSVLFLVCVAVGCWCCTCSLAVLHSRGDARPLHPPLARVLPTGQAALALQLDCSSAP